VTHTIITDCWKGNSIPSGSNDNTVKDILYPNPNNGLLYIEISGRRKASAEIYNSNGQLIQVYPLGLSKTTINTENLVKGFYLVKIITSEGITLAKFIKY
jgi:hypothetical protein